MTAGDAEFFTDWQVYRSIIDNDCMEHRAIFSALGRSLARRTERFSVLDLGCGDAAGVAAALAGLPVARYHGVDRAAPALASAGDTMAAVAGHVWLSLADIMVALATDDERYDVIVASFAVHHFDGEGKRRFFDLAAKRLTADGELVLVDVVRRDGESRDEYLQRYASLVDSWQIPEGHKQRVKAHVRGHDFPEERSDLPRWAAAAGLTEIEMFYSGGSDTQAAWRMARESQVLRQGNRKPQ
jgi:SAM-dependent methyltransferase